MAAKEQKLDTFTWDGKDRKGNKTSGETTGASPALVKAQLRKQGITPRRSRRRASPCSVAVRRSRPLTSLP